MEILVTGGTGNLGALVVERLRTAGHTVRVLSRSTRPGVITGDLLTNVGIEVAVRGTDVVVHCATGSDDVKATKNLVDACTSAGCPHVVYVSIVGVDRIPFFFYRRKLQAEAVVSGSGLPFTILRATQFHTLLTGIFGAQRRLPVLLVPDFSLQPVAPSEVAETLARVAVDEPAGRVPDLGGPEIRPAREFAEAWQRVEGRRRRIVSLKLPGRTFRALRAGHNVTHGIPTGSITFGDYLASRHR